MAFSINKKSNILNKVIIYNILEYLDISIILQQLEHFPFL